MSQDGLPKMKNLKVKDPDDRKASSASIKSYKPKISIMGKLKGKVKRHRESKRPKPEITLIDSEDKTSTLEKYRKEAVFDITHPDGATTSMCSYSARSSRSPSAASFEGVLDVPPPQLDDITPNVDSNTVIVDECSTSIPVLAECSTAVVYAHTPLTRLSVPSQDVDALSDRTLEADVEATGGVSESDMSQDDVLDSRCSRSSGDYLDCDSMGIEYKLNSLGRRSPIPPPRKPKKVAEPEAEIGHPIIVDKTMSIQFTSDACAAVCVTPTSPESNRSRSTTLPNFKKSPRPSPNKFEKKSKSYVDPNTKDFKAGSNSQDKDSDSDVYRYDYVDHREKLGSKSIKKLKNGIMTFKRGALKREKDPTTIKPVMNQAGHLFKRGEAATSEYHRKWFRLSPKGLGYNKNEVDKGSPTVLTLNYMRCELAPEIKDSSTPHARYYFKIKPDSMFERTYVLAAESDYERRKWMVSISECNRVHFKHPFKQTTIATKHYMNGTTAENMEECVDEFAIDDVSSEEIYEPIETCPRNIHGNSFIAGEETEDLYLDHDQLYTGSSRSDAIYDSQMYDSVDRKPSMVIQNKTTPDSLDPTNSIISESINEDDNYLCMDDLNPEVPGMGNKDFNPFFVLGPKPKPPPSPIPQSRSTFIDDDELYAKGFSVPPGDDDIYADDADENIIDDDDIYADVDTYDRSGNLIEQSRHLSYYPSEPPKPPPPDTYPTPRTPSRPIIGTAPPPLPRRDTEIFGHISTSRISPTEYDEEEGLYADSGFIPDPAIPSRNPLVEDEVFDEYDDEDLYADGESIQIRHTELAPVFSVPPPLPPKLSPKPSPDLGHLSRDSSSGRSKKKSLKIKNRKISKMSLTISEPQLISGPKFDQLSLAEKHSPNPPHSPNPTLDAIIEPPPTGGAPPSVVPHSRRNTVPTRPAPSPLIGKR